jgi:hypothetical protein
VIALTYGPDTQRLPPVEAPADPGSLVGLLGVEPFLEFDTG